MLIFYRGLNRLGKETMVNAEEINAKLDTHMLQQDERLERIKDSITTLTAIVTNV